MVLAAHILHICKSVFVFSHLYIYMCVTFREKNAGESFHRQIVSTKSKDSERDWLDVGFSLVQLDYLF